MSQAEVTHSTLFPSLLTYNTLPLVSSQHTHTLSTLLRNVRRRFGIVVFYGAFFSKRNNHHQRWHHCGYTVAANGYPLGEHREKRMLPGYKHTRPHTLQHRLYIFTLQRRLESVQHSDNSSTPPHGAHSCVPFLFLREPSQPRQTRFTLPGSDGLSYLNNNDFFLVSTFKNLPIGVPLSSASVVFGPARAFKCTNRILQRTL